MRGGTKLKVVGWLGWLGWLLMFFDVALRTWFVTSLAVLHGKRSVRRLVFLKLSIQRLLTRMTSFMLLWLLELRYGFC
jgi:hypothetical protein